MALLERLGPLGVWTSLDALPVAEAAALAGRLEEWGYAALWIPEVAGRDPFAMIGYLAAQTRELVFATGIANIYARDPLTMKGVHRGLSDIAPGRFVLGLGVSHKHLVSNVRGHAYTKPVPAMRDYLDAMDQALWLAAEPADEAPIVLAALRRHMLRLAASRTRGAHPYLVPPEHTARAREILGPDAWLCPEQMVLRETDPSRAREIARGQLVQYLRAPNYQNNLLELGFGEDDFADGGSDRLVDAIVAWGDESAIRARVQEHMDAGADHVCIQPFRPDGKPGPDLDLLGALAPR